MKYEFHTIRREREPFVNQNVFARTHASGWRAAVEKVAFWILRGLKSYHRGELDSYKRVTINTDSLADLIQRQAQECRYLHNREVRGVILGYAEAEMLRIESNAFLTVTIPFDGGRPQFRGIDLYVLPWVKGVTVLPELK